MGVFKELLTQAMALNPIQGDKPMDLHDRMCFLHNSFSTYLFDVNELMSTSCGS